jgi:hypothetical protein
MNLNSWEGDTPKATLELLLPYSTQWKHANEKQNAHNLKCVATPLWRKCEVATHTFENGTWESSRTPKNSELDYRSQNTSHWSVPYTIEKVSKCRCLKWPRISHLDICSTSYGWKKGRESNWQFDSRPNSRESTWSRCVQLECNTPLKSYQGELQVFFKSCPNRRSGREVMNAQSPGSPNLDSFGTPLWESREKVPFRCKCSGEAQKILYGGRWWLPPSPSRGESSESVLPVICPNTKVPANVN